MTETIECIGLLKQAGFVGSICTPHYAVQRYRGVNRGAIQKQVHQLQSDLDNAGVDWQVFAGGEIRLAKNEAELLTNDETPRLGNSRCVLFDWWEKTWPVFLDEYFARLIDDGLQPILAHPERLPLGDALFERTMDQLIENGIWLQGNLKSYAPESEKRVTKRAKKLLEQNRYKIIASDSHGPRSIPSRLDGLAVLRDLVDESTLRLLLAVRPRELIAANAPKP